MRLIDTHCHINDPKSFPDPAEAVAHAAELGVDRLIAVAVDEGWSRNAVALADQFPGVYAVVGWHPTSSPQYRREGLATIRDLAQHPKAVAIGEIGYDFYWKTASREEQDQCLADHIDLAEELGMPVVFHCRDAYPELLGWLEQRRPASPLLLHCFAGTLEEGMRAANLGCHFGFDGPLTYPKNEELRRIFASLPPDRIVLETDAPYMTPVPYRGQKNKPGWVVEVNRTAAQVWGITPEQSAARTTANAERFFRLEP
jgi:TatD DNase family protein